jgi:hypothetical protein
MIYRTFSARVFSLVFVISYAVVVHWDHPLFRYYPLLQRWSLHDLTDPALGPAMSWYGWIALAGIPALLLAALVPKSIGDCIPAAVYWVLPFVAFVAGYYHEQVWFQ